MSVQLKKSLRNKLRKKYRNHAKFLYILIIILIAVVAVSVPYYQRYINTQPIKISNASTQYPDGSTTNYVKNAGTPIVENYPEPIAYFASTNDSKSNNEGKTAPPPVVVRSGTSLYTKSEGGDPLPSLSSSYDPVQVIKVLVIIYDTHLQNPTYPWGGPWAGPEQLSYALEEGLEQASKEKELNTGSTYSFYRPNIEIDIKEIIQHNYAVPQLPSNPRADYNAILNAHNVCSRVNTGEINEVWVWADRTGGLWESTMAGPENQIFYTNGIPIIRVDCNEPIAIMGFNYEFWADEPGNNPGVAYSFHTFGHRMESTVAKFLDNIVPGGALPNQGHNYFAFDGKVGYNGVVHPYNYCGNVHWTPNAQTWDEDYEYNLTRTVTSTCNTWNPRHTSSTVSMNCSTWGCTHQGYLKWWYSKMPGREKSVGMRKLNNTDMPNWWKLLVKFDPEQDPYYKVAECGSGIGPIVKYGQGSSPVTVTPTQGLYANLIYAGDNTSTAELCFHGNYTGPGWENGWVCLRDSTPSDNIYLSYQSSPKPVSDINLSANGTFNYNMIKAALINTGHTSAEIDQWGILWSTNVAQNNNQQMCMGNGDLRLSDGTLVKEGCRIKSSCHGFFKKTN